MKKNGTTTIEIKSLRTLATEIFKTINNINPSHVKNVFTPKTNTEIRPHDIIVRNHNTASLTVVGPEIWNKLPTNIKHLTSITIFKEYIRTSFGPSSKRNFCRIMVKYFFLFFKRL